jgi:hypothetical protein
MVLRRFLSILFIFFRTSLFGAESVDCEDLFTRELRAFLENDRSNFVGRFYAQTLFKTAALVRFENTQTTEDFAKRLQGRARLLSPNPASDEQLNNELMALYRRWGMNEDFLALEESLRASSPWRASLRLSNEQMAQFILAHSQLMDSSPYTSADAAVVWLVHSLLEKSGPELPPGSLLYNQLALSPVVTRLVETRPSGHELLESFSAEAHRLQEDINQLYQHFFERHHTDCGAWLELEHCTGQRFLFHWALPQVLIDLKNQTEALAEIALNNQLRADFRGQLTLVLNDQSYRHPPSRTITEPVRPQQDFSHLPPTIRPTPEAIRVSELRAFEHEFLEIEDEEEKLHHFHRDLAPDHGLYAVIDRASQLVRFFEQGQLIHQARLVAPQGVSDRHEHGGAGLYRFAYSGDRGLIFLSDQHQRNTSFRLERNDPKTMELLQNATTLYVLPVEEHLEFRLKDGQLIFTHQRQLRHTHLYNFSPRQTTFRPLRTEIANPDLRNSTTTTFVTTLDAEKERLMEIYNLDNDEYNELARLSFGILGNESNFGRSPRYKVKEALPWVVSLLKGDWFDTTSNSRGPTQIKTVPALIAQHYGVTKQSLSRPEHAAVATLGFLAQSLSELKNREHHHPGITPYNRMDYLHYIYMGRVSEITRGTATPERNIYYRNMHSAAAELVQWEELSQGP